MARGKRMIHIRLFLCGSSIIAWTSAYGHETSTHQNIGNVAVTYLQNSLPARPSLTNLATLLRIGAVLEDDEALTDPIVHPLPFVRRSYFHFYPPLNFLLPGVAAVS